MSLRNDARDAYLALPPELRAEMKRKFACRPSTLRRIEAFERYEATGEPVPETNATVTAEIRPDGSVKVTDNDGESIHVSRAEILFNNVKAPKKRADRWDGGRPTKPDDR